MPLNPSRPWLPLLLLPLSAMASLPQLDFGKMGKVGLAGSFAGLDLFSNDTAPFDPSTSTLLSRSSQGALDDVASTNPGGSILAGCSLNGLFYFAGSFSTIGNTTANITAANIASLDPSTGHLSALGSNGPNGEVRALFCDASNNKLWAGGSFTSPASAVAVWDTKAGSWSAPPFGGLSGAAAEVSSITTNASASSIFLSGSFVASFSGGNGTTAINGTNNPNVPFSAGATPFSSSLVPIPLTGNGTQIQGSPSTTQSGFDNIDNVLCPAGSDGPGNSWFAADGNSALVTARAFEFISANGIRLGNTFLQGRGTTGFSVATIPDNTVQTLKFVDPSTGANQTCSNPCPLLTDSSILYQDFLFENPLNITGVQVTLSEWQGAGPGLHIFQLLSSGAFASAVGSDNAQSCFAPNPSSTQQTGTWTEKVANTGIAGTTQAVLVSDVSVGTTASNGPSFTWMPYVSASGEYDINLLVPGCTDFQDCPQRTSVKVVVFPGGNISPQVTTVSQQNENDASVLIYSGPIVPTSNTFSVTVEMTLADSPAGTGEGGQWELVADRVQLVLNSANISATSSSSSGNNGTNGTSGTTSSFGFFEWPLSSSTTANATSTLPNTTETALDRIGVDMFSSLGGSSSLSSSSDAIVAVAHHSSGAIILAGNFTLSSGSASGSKNIVMFKNGALTALSENGLNGPVTSLVLDQDDLFVGGSFQGTAAGSTNGVGGVALYNVAQNSWSALQGGVDGAVRSLAFSNGEVQVAGNFTKVLSTAGSSSGASAAGLAVWSVGNSTWVNSGGFLVGSMTFVGNGTAPSKGQSQSQFVAGSVSASFQFGASGFVMLSNGRNGVPNVTPLGVQLDSGANSSTISSKKRRSSHFHRTATSLFPRVTRLFSRQSSQQLPLSAPSSGPSVSAGAFWTNSSSKHEVVIIGGNFSFTAPSGSQANNLAVYDASTGSVTALRGAQPSGVVQTLLVQGDDLFVGGQFTLQGSSASGFAVYDLAQQQWAASNAPALIATSGSAVVRSLTTSQSVDKTVIVAGTFTGAGSVSCNGICAFDTSENAWKLLGNGIQGSVEAVVYGGKKQGSLVASGAISLSDGTAANVAQYTFANSSWSAVGSGSDLPGPVTAVEVNNGNLSSIWAAGRSSDSSSAFLSMWDGSSWSSLGSSLGSSTNISQLLMVPLSDTHASNGLIEKDRMLLISGSISDPSFGNASSALFDGQSFIPYITSTSSNGSPGGVSALVHSFATFNFAQHHFLATGIVILISIAIAAGIVFLLVLIGILWTLFARKDDSMDKFDPSETGDDDDSLHHRPSSLLEHINAATRTTILGNQSPYNQFGAEKEAEATGAAGVAAAAADGSDPFGDDGRESPDAAAGGDDQGRLAHARYSFDGGEEGELPLASGSEVEILDDRDAAWWYARDPRTGREGVIPSNYVY